MTPYEEGRRNALWAIWCLLENMDKKFPMTGRPDAHAAFKNGWNDVVYTLRRAARGWKK